MFIGRDKELVNLNRRYKNDKFEAAIIYGRRRVGKTTLVNEFTKDKETIFYTGIESNTKENLEGLSNSIYALSDDFAHGKGSFSSFKEALEVVFRISRQRRIIFVIDEYPYLANSYPAISSILQLLIDQNKENSKMFLILCGSSMPFMEHQVLGYESPLFGRHTCQFKILPFEFAEMKNFFRNFNNEELAIIYGITGGIPLYLSLMDDTLGIEENIKSNFLEDNAYLFEEPTNLIKQECRDPSQYNAIIKAIATGASRMSEICTKVGIDTSLAANYLNRLISIGIVKKEMPMNEKNIRKGIYVLEDPMFRFWYRFVPDHMASIYRGLTDNVYQTIAPQIPDFMGKVFEEICLQYLWGLNRQGEIAIPFHDIGRWWGTDSRNRCEAEIDIMSVSDQEAVIFGECKWNNEKVGAKVLTSLVEKSRIFHYLETHFYLFSKAGFTKGCEELAREMGNVTMVTLDDMLS